MEDLIIQCSPHPPNNHPNRTTNTRGRTRATPRPHRIPNKTNCSLGGGHVLHLLGPLSRSGKCLITKASEPVNTIENCLVLCWCLAPQCKQNGVCPSRELVSHLSRPPSRQPRDLRETSRGEPPKLIEFLLDPSTLLIEFHSPDLIGTRANVIKKLILATIITRPVTPRTLRTPLELCKH